MIPHMKLWQRIVAWALWRFNGWSDPEECRFECMTQPELSRVVGMMRDYWYVRHARELAERGQ